MFYFFTAEWCNHCKMIKPVIEELIKDGYEIEIKDADNDRDLLDELMVMEVPTIVYVGKNYKNNLHCVLPKNDIIDWIKISKDNDI